MTRVSIMSMQISRVKGVKYHGHLAICKYIDFCCLPGSPTKEINYRLMFEIVPELQR